MKKFILPLTIGAVIAGVTTVVFYSSESSTQPASENSPKLVHITESKQVSQQAKQEEPVEEKIQKKSVKPNQDTAKVEKKAEPEAEPVQFDDVIQQFPHLTEEVVAYRLQVKQLESEMDNYRDAMRQRNEIAKQGYQLTDYEREQLAKERDLLLEKSRELGREAMALAALIREATKELMQEKEKDV